jgi:putative acetyltransferase
VIGAVIRLPGGCAAGQGGAVLIRREAESDVGVIGSITAAAFARPNEATLIDELRGSPAWIPALSLVAVEPGGEVTGHVLCSRAHVDDVPVLALGPVAVRPDRQRAGVGSALMHAVLGAGDALGEPLVVLLGDPGYYGRFGFGLAAEYAITPPVPGWQPHFQVRPLAAYRPSVRGAFRYAEPFDRT